MEETTSLDGCQRMLMDECGWKHESIFNHNGIYLPFLFQVNQAGIFSFPHHPCPILELVTLRLKQPLASLQEGAQ